MTSVVQVPWSMNLCCFNHWNAWPCIVRAGLAQLLPKKCATHQSFLWRFHLDPTLFQVTREILWILGNPNHLYRNLSRGLQRRFVSKQARASSRGNISSWFNQKGLGHSNQTINMNVKLGWGCARNHPQSVETQRPQVKEILVQGSGGWFALPCGEGVRHANPGEPCHCHQPSVFGGAVANSVCASTDWPLPGGQLTHELPELLLPTIEQRGKTSDLQRSSFTCNRLGAHVLQGQWQWQTAGTEGAFRLLPRLHLCRVVTRASCLALLSIPLLAAAKITNL